MSYIVRKDHRIVLGNAGVVGNGLDTIGYYATICTSVENGGENKWVDLHVTKNQLRNLGEAIEARLKDSTHDLVAERVSEDIEKQVIAKFLENQRAKKQVGGKYLWSAEVYENNTNNFPDDDNACIESRISSMEEEGWEIVSASVFSDNGIVTKYSIVARVEKP